MKLEKIQDDILKLYSGDTNIQNIRSFIVKYCKENKLYLHKANIIQLSWSIYIQLTDYYKPFIDMIIDGDEGLKAIREKQKLNKI